MAVTAQRNMPWSLKGISHEARAAAKAAAKLAGMPLGAWLSGAIRAAGSNTDGDDTGGAGGRGLSSIERAMVHDLTFSDDPGKAFRGPLDPDRD